LRLRLRFAKEDAHNIGQVKLTNHTAAHRAQFEGHIRKFDRITDIFEIAGEYDYLLTAVAKEWSEYHTFLCEKIVPAQNIAAHKSSLVVNTVQAAPAKAPQLRDYPLPSRSRRGICSRSLRRFGGCIREAILSLLGTMILDCHSEHPRCRISDARRPSRRLWRSVDGEVASAGVRAG